MDTQRLWLRTNPTQKTPISNCNAERARKPFTGMMTTRFGLFAVSAASCSIWANGPVKVTRFPVPPPILPTIHTRSRPGFPAKTNTRDSLRTNAARLGDMRWTHAPQRIDGHSGQLHQFRKARPAQRLSVRMRSGRFNRRQGYVIHAHNIGLFDTLGIMARGAQQYRVRHWPFTAPRQLASVQMQTTQL